MYYVLLYLTCAFQCHHRKHSRAGIKSSDKQFLEFMGVRELDLTKLKDIVEETRQKDDRPGHSDQAQKGEHPGHLQNETILTKLGHQMIVLPKITPRPIYFVSHII